MKVAYTWAKHTGRTYKQLNYVRIYKDIGTNKIGQKGFPYLCKQQWPKLTVIILCNNIIDIGGIKINDTGVEVLKRAYT